MGSPPTYGPAYNLYIYLYRPLYVWEYVMSSLVTSTFLERLDDRPLISPESGEILRTELLAPGARLTLQDYLDSE